MEVSKNKKSFSYLRIIFCISFLAIWTAWLINLPRVRNQSLEVKGQRSELKKQKPGVGYHEREIGNQKPATQEQKIETSSKKYQIRKEITAKSQAASTVSQSLASNSKHPVPSAEHSVIKNELPKLANLTPVKEKEPEKQRSKEIDLSFPTIAQATRNALLISKMVETTQTPRTSTPHEKEVLLRKKIPHSNNTPNDITTEDKWLPKYLKASKELAPKIENASINLDKIANQLELVGLINNPDGKGAAIIRNKTNNKIEILKRGEEYKELKLLEINNNEVVLGNQDLNKKYIKKIVFSK